MLYSVLSISDIGGSLGIGTAELDSSLFNLMQWFLGIMSLIALLAIVVGGADYMISGSTEGEKERAKRIITWAVAGLVVCLLSWAAVFFIARNASNVTKPKPRRVSNIPTLMRTAPPQQGFVIDG